MARKKQQQLAREVDAVIAPSVAPCPSCPKCPHRSAVKSAPKKSRLAAALIGAALGTMGLAMASVGGRKSR